MITQGKDGILRPLSDLGKILTQFLHQGAQNHSPMRLYFLLLRLRQAWIDRLGQLDQEGNRPGEDSHDLVTYRMSHNRNGIDKDFRLVATVLLIEYLILYLTNAFLSQVPSARKDLPNNRLTEGVNHWLGNHSLVSGNWLSIFDLILKVFLAWGILGRVV